MIQYYTFSPWGLLFKETGLSRDTETNVCFWRKYQALPNYASDLRLYTQDKGMKKHSSRFL